jgi:hypothetical protein
MATAAKRIGMTLPDYVAHLIADEKYCSGCKAWHDIDAFGSDASRADGRAASCLRFRRVRRSRMCSK